MIDKLKDLLIVVIILLVVLAGFTGLLVWLVGLEGFVIGISVIAVVLVVFGAFAAGSYWTRSSMETGAKLAIVSSNNNDANDAAKIEALSGLLKEAIKAQSNYQKSLPSPQAGYPALPLFGPSTGLGLDATEGSFTIDGLDNETD
ncbi:MAG: hypothetical protein DPW09_00550 [Anaerolineae bacterium]|nr:hypothetical protein [Anaerolineae bacterium]